MKKANELKNSRDCYKQFDLQTLKRLRNAFEQDMENPKATKDYGFARIVILNSLIIERLLGM